MAIPIATADRKVCCTVIHEAEDCRTEEQLQNHVQSPTPATDEDLKKKSKFTDTFVFSLCIQPAALTILMPRFYV